MKKGLIRQGDVLLIPSNKKFIFSEKGTAVLALGEVSGHSHRIMNAQFVKGDNGLATAILLDAPQQLMHEEHDAKVIPAKQVFEVRVQRRVDALGEIRKVMD